MTLATSKSFNQPLLPAVFPHWCHHLVIPHVGSAANLIWLLQHHNTRPSRYSRYTRGVTLLSIRGEAKKKIKKNPTPKPQVSFVSGDYNGNGRGVKVWWATVEIAVTTRGWGEGYIILKCPKRDEARELESLQWHAGFAVVLFAHSLLVHIQHPQ